MASAKTKKVVGIKVKLPKGAKIPKGPKMSTHYSSKKTVYKNAIKLPTLKKIST